MIEHIARFPRLRDRAIFVGDPDDIVPDTFGPGLPAIRDWTRQHYDFAGYITGFDPAQPPDRRALGYRDDERVCIVTVGGSGSAATCCAASSPPTPRAKTWSRNYGWSSSRGRGSTPTGCPHRTGWRSAATSPTCIATWPPATSRWSRAGSPPPWN